MNSYRLRSRKGRAVELLRRVPPQHSGSADHRLAEAVVLRRQSLRSAAASAGVAEGKARSRVERYLRRLEGFEPPRPHSGLEAHWKCAPSYALQYALNVLQSVAHGPAL